MIEAISLFGWGVMLGYVLARNERKAANEADTALLELGRAIGEDMKDVMLKRKLIGEGFSITKHRGDDKIRITVESVSTTAGGRG